MSTRIRIMCLVMSLLMAAALFAGCGQSAGSGTDSPGNSPTSEQEAPVVETPAESAKAPEVLDPPATDAPIEISYPLTEEGAELSMFMMFAEVLVNYYESYADTVFWQELETRTGVHISFEITPGIAALTQQMNIMFASGDYTDIINSVSLELDSLVDEGIVQPLNENIATCMPDYLNAISGSEEMQKAALNDAGLYVAAYGFYDSVYSPTYGPVIRQDWLDKLNMDVPVTYDDYYEVMKGFITECGAQYGMALSYTGVPYGDYLVAGFGVAGYANNSLDFAPFYQVDGVVKYGLIEDGFLEYLTLINQWYAEGLIDSDFFSYTVNPTYPSDDDIASSALGIWYTQAALVDRYSSMFDQDSGFSLSPMKDAVKEAGDVSHFNSAQVLGTGQASIITTACENLEMAMKWLNYGYTEEGSLLCNYGLEGVSFEYVDGKPTFTDLVISNPEIPMNFAISYYALGFGAFIQDSQRMVAAFKGATKDAMNIWAASGDGAYAYPHYASLTSDESVRFDEVYNEIDTYASTMILKFVIGEEPLENFESFVEQINQMGLEECISIKQASYDRYINR